MKSISEAFDSFAHALRINTEHLIRAPQLMRIDPQECAGNLDQGLSAILNAFHSIYDAAKDDPHVVFAWNRTAPTATLLAFRNAKHHNHARRIRSLETFFTRGGKGRTSNEYGLVAYGRPPGSGEPLFIQAISWTDTNELLNMPYETTHLSADRVATIYSYLGGDAISAFARLHHPDLPIFFDALPLIVNAARAVVPVLEPRIERLSMESEGFLDHFKSVDLVDMAVQHVRVERFKI
ncbi:hypothetical protein NKI72_29505 [Mesorhizobium sp. M0437]|uniref:hypothetical protein n=1 Tax=Mesorhizobium sp. M0437 TaxID=2956945 RepID=UPI0033353BE0